MIVFPLEIRGRREDRVRAAPAVSCAIAHKKRAHEHTGSAEALRPSLRNGFTAYFVLSPVNGSFATVARAFLLASLTPAPRRQDHTTKRQGRFPRGFRIFSAAGPGWALDHDADRVELAGLILAGIGLACQLSAT